MFSMFFAGSSFESPFEPLFDLVLRPFSNISAKMPTEGPKRRSRGAWRGGLILRSLRASSRNGRGGTPVGAVSGARRLLPEGSDHYIITFWAPPEASQKNATFVRMLCFCNVLPE